ncbi:hypothetical protein Srot_0037 [Segniliparus rotundus DSM 44985]|uniref:Uncharacterized protein n=1 Tax=Segniliparus rotundus (strain ATCC BAA-972 / CDC 1076 / CIP 108378 / DSM 44985 / JCM 13578) TaxID=640132 RepID=D6Z9K3_SEGRD|nr:hypothetical protein Srot_0037 [Segniliparus rotundus DSM 44985]
MCPAHERQLHRRGEGGLTPLGVPLWKGCVVPGCERRRFGKNMCGLHLNRSRKGLPLDPWTRHDEKVYQSALRGVAGVFERRVAVEIEAGECRAEAERKFRVEFQLLASFLDDFAGEGALR